ncbi:hypothetical protein AYO49_02105 [Verrucomicrobiaceae bacterium SCGC AG-212-N21]|nr:hypothetical protein AYO49_02105 [Verrucomicrobiaceae bacterium SCGC AG-212-N21]
MSSTIHPTITSCLGRLAGLLCSLAFTWGSNPVLAESHDELLKRGDTLDIQLHAKEALECFLEVEKAQPQNAAVLVKIARQYRHLMADAEGESEKLKLGQKALEYGKRAASMAPQNSDAQLSCAISYGKMLPLMGKRDQVSWSRLIKEGAERAIKLDERNDLAWHILGRWHHNVANVGTVTRALASMIYEKLPDASNEDAVRCLEHAIRVNPNRLMHYIELGRTYADMGNETEARRYLERGLSMPCVDKDDPGMKAAGREALQALR